MRRYIVVVLSVLLLAAVMTVNVFAAGGSATVSTVTGAPDEKVTVNISLTGFENANSLAVKFSYESGLTLVAEESGWLVDGVLEDLNAVKNEAVWANTSAVDVNKNILKLVFTVPEPVEGQQDLDYTVDCTVEVMFPNASPARVQAQGKVTIHNPAKSVALNKHVVALEVGQTETLTATPNPINTTEKIVWASSDPSVATVANGVVTAVKNGSAVITATAGNAVAQCDVSVVCLHTQKTSHSAVEPKCNATGMQAYYSCNACDVVFEADGVTQTTLAKLTVATVSHAGGTATCTQKALCKWCQQPYGETVSHSGGTATCSQKAICTMCQQPYGSTVPHQFGTAWLSDGTNHWHKCNNCTEIKDKAAHAFQWKVDEEATEDKTGLKHEECKCGVKRSEGTVIEKLDHKHTGIKHFASVKATCVKAGTVEYWTCSSAKCTGKYYADAKCQLEIKTIVEAINKDNHTGGTEVKDAVEATCNKEGYSGDTYCLGCKALVKKGEAVAATGKHVAGDKWLTNDSEHWHTCTTQGCEALVDKAAHAYTWKTDKKATEGETGLKHEECVCGLKRSENTVISKLEHKPGLVAGKDATCTEEGALEHFYCYNCGRYYASENGQLGEQIQKDQITVAATGHSFAEAYEADDKAHWHVCACGETSEKEAHNTELKNAKEATGETEGYTGDEVCSVCEKVVKEGEVIPVLTVGATTEPTETAPATTEPVDQEGGNGIVFIVIVVAVIAVGGGLFFFLKKRKA